jgi:alpha-mannosidase
MGYATYVIAPDSERAEPFGMPRDPRVERVEDWAIENECLRLECHPVTSGGAMTLTDKRDGRAYAIDGFSLVKENPRRGMTAWVVGEQMDKLSLSKGYIVKRSFEGELYNELSFSMKFGERSSLEFTIGLAAGSEQLIIDAKCDFLELTDERGLPQLRFDITDPHMSGDCVYDVPGGLLPRKSAPVDMPGIRFIAGDNLALISDSKYGYRSVSKTMGVTLIRASADPDPYPELRSHRFRLCVSMRRGQCAKALVNSAQAFLSPLTMVSGTAHAGKLPLELSLLRAASGSIELSAVKLAEDGCALAVRGVELSGDGHSARLEFYGTIKSARFADTHEEPVPGDVIVSANAVEFNARPFGIFTLLIELA